MVYKIEFLLIHLIINNIGEFLVFPNVFSRPVGHLSHTPQKTEGVMCQVRVVGHLKENESSPQEQ